MSVHYKNNSIAKKIWLFETKSIQKVLGKIYINIMINPIFKEERILHLIYEN